MGTWRGGGGYQRPHRCQRQCPCLRQHQCQWRQRWQRALTHAMLSPWAAAASRPAASEADCAVALPGARTALAAARPADSALPRALDAAVALAAAGRGGRGGAEGGACDENLAARLHWQLRRAGRGEASSCGAANCLRPAKRAHAQVGGGPGPGPGLSSGMDVGGPGPPRSRAWAWVQVVTGLTHITSNASARVGRGHGLDGACGQVMWDPGGLGREGGGGAEPAADTDLIMPAGGSHPCLVSGWQQPPTCLHQSSSSAAHKEASSPLPPARDTHPWHRPRRMPVWQTVRQGWGSHWRRRYCWHSLCGLHCIVSAEGVSCFRGGGGGPARHPMKDAPLVASALKPLQHSLGGPWRRPMTQRGLARSKTL